MYYLWNSNKANNERKMKQWKPSPGNFAQSVTRKPNQSKQKYVQINMH